MRRHFQLNNGKLLFSVSRPAINATGGYAAQLVQASNALSGLASPHIDAIINYTPAAATETALTANEQSILDTEGRAEPFDVLELANLELGLSLARKRPAKYDGLKARLEKLVTLSSTQVNILKVQTILSIMTNDLIERSRVQPCAGCESNHQLDYI